MKKIIIPLTILVTIVVIFLFSCPKQEPSFETDDSDNNVIIADNKENSSNALKDNSDVKENTEENQDTSLNQNEDSASSDYDSSESVNEDASSKGSEDSKSSATNKTPDSDSNKLETVKPSSNTSKPESTTQTPNSNLSKPSDSKPETGGTPSNNQSSSGNQSNDKTENKPSHTHTWTETYKTVSHKEEREDVWVVDIPAYTEEVPVYAQVPKTICNTCREPITKEDIENGHVKAHALAGATQGGWHTEVFTEQIGTETVYHEEEGHWESVVVKEAYTEQILTGYKCECGKTKSL